MLAATEQDRADFLQIAHEIGKELLRHPEAFRAPRPSVGRMQKNICACIVELKMTADGQGRNAATAPRPQAGHGQEQPVAIFFIFLSFGFVLPRYAYKL